MLTTHFFSRPANGTGGWVYIQGSYGSYAGRFFKRLIMGEKSGGKAEQKGQS